MPSVKLQRLRLSHGTSRMCWPRPAIMGEVLGIVHRALATRLISKAGLTRKTAHRRRDLDPALW